MTRQWFGPEFAGLLVGFVRPGEIAAAAAQLAQRIQSGAGHPDVRVDEVGAGRRESLFPLRDFAVVGLSSRRCTRQMPE